MNHGETKGLNIRATRGMEMRNNREDVHLLNALKTCAKSKDLQNVDRIGTEILKRNLLQRNLQFGRNLVNSYGNCGALLKAQEVFDQILYRDTACWTALISGYTRNGYAREALSCFARMKCEGIAPNSISFIYVLKACGNIESADKGHKIHADIVMDPSLANDVLVSTALVDMYAQIGCLEQATAVFDQLAIQDMVSWTVLIKAYVEHGYGDEALNYFEQMQQEGHVPDMCSISCVLKACGGIGAIQVGKQIHAKIVEGGCLERDKLFDTALVDMYAKCGELVKAKEIFDSLQNRNVVSWTALLCGYVQHGYAEEALTFFAFMQQQRISPNSVTFLCVLKACRIIGAIDKGNEVYEEIKKRGLVEKDLFLGNTLIDMYAKCGMLAKAHNVFTQLKIHNVVSWNVIIAGYVQHDHAEKAIDLFEQMQYEGLFPNAATFACILKACGSIGTVEKGKSIHYKVAAEGLLKKDIMIGNALLDMYVKCGVFLKAQEVFDELPFKDVAAWTALITAYAQQEREGEMVYLFGKMLAEGVEPNIVTFTVIINACSHLGLLQKGEMYFELMSVDYGIMPNVEHYACMIDLFSRAGHFEKAIEVINRMPFSDYAPMWTTLLGACGKWGNTEVGRFAFENALQLDPKDAATYICMGNAYVSSASHS